MSKEELILLDCGVSPFCGRVRIALAEKGVEYENREENVLGGKSELLLSSNPVYKKVPVLLHNGRPVCESSIIVQYVEETWPSPPLLPTCPYQRAQARFWGDFIDKKVFEGGSKIWNSTLGEELGVANKDFIEILKQLEGALGDKNFFGGENLGFVDILLVPLTTWFPAYEKFGGFKVEDECPKFSAWVKRCMQRENVVKALPDPDMVYQVVLMLRRMNGID